MHLCSCEEWRHKPSSHSPEQLNTRHLLLAIGHLQTFSCSKEDQRSELRWYAGQRFRQCHVQEGCQRRYIQFQNNRHYVQKTTSFEWSHTIRLEALW